MNVKYPLVLSLIIVCGAAALFAFREKQGPAPSQASVTQEAAPAALSAVQAPKPGSVQTAEQAPDHCLLPGPPPVPPNGDTASAADMKLGHDVIQAFVLQLEAYQACRNDQLDHAPAGVSAEQKEAWLEQGNAAVDQANALASAFAVQLKAYKSQKHQP